MQNDIPMRMVAEYMHYIAPSKNDDPCMFEERAIAEWTAGEILDEISNHPMKPAAETVEAFLVKMEMFHYRSTQSCNKLRFSIARDTAEEIGLMLI